MTTTILIVDDDRVILTFAGKLLEREGHEVRTAADVTTIRAAERSRELSAG